MKTSLSAVSILLLAFAAAAQPAEPPFSADRFRAHVAFLSDDLLEGRDTGSRGHEVASRYVANQFASLGLKPGGDAGTWYQRVTFQRTVRISGSVTVKSAGGEKTYANGDNVLVGISARDLKLDLSAPLVFVGYGIEDKRFKLDDYRGLDVKGKIVVVLSGFPKGLASEEGAHLAAVKAQIAEKHGAIGMLGVDTLQSEKAFPWTMVMQYSRDPEFSWVDDKGVPFSEAPGIRGSAYLNGPVAETVFAGSGHTLADIRKEADRMLVSPRGFALKTSARIQAESTAERISSPNVVAILPGSDPELAAQYVVLSGHLDHLGIKDVDTGTDDGDYIYNGVLDNAAGAATLIEVAHAAVNASSKPRRSIIFLASTAEERGLLGADYYARHPTVPISRIVGNVDVDLPLLLYSFTDVVAFGADHCSLGRQVADAVAPMNLKLSPDPWPEQGIFTRSDHYMFVKQGVPAVFLVTGTANGGSEAWAGFLEKTYHSPKDDMNQSIDWEAGARFVEANYRVTRAIADADTPPLWNLGDYFGDTFAPSAPRAAKQ